MHLEIKSGRKALSYIQGGGKMTKIVLIEDEEKVGKIITAYLETEGYNVDWYRDGNQGWNVISENEPDLLILDLMLPGLLGEEICRHLRNKGSQLPIVMLTARGSEEERVRGLEIGADDYLVKPFSVRELMARIQAILRRVNPEKEGVTLAQQLVFTSGDKILEIDLTHRVVKVDNQLKELTATEFKLLAILAQNPQRPFTREELIIKLQGYDYEGFDRTVDAHIKNIRRKLNLQTNQFIITIYRIGYKFAEGDLENV